MNLVLQAAREASGKTQAQVAKESYITVVAYQRYEYGTRKPDVYTAQLIALAVGSTVEKLWSLEQQSAPGGNPALDE